MQVVHTVNARLVLDLMIVQPTATKFAQDDYLNASPAPPSNQSNASNPVDASTRAIKNKNKSD